MRWATTAHVGPWLVIVGLAACQVYDPALVQSEPETPQCQVTRPPPRPSGEDDGIETGPHVFALRDVLFDQGAGVWETIGYDLDGLCTGLPDYPRSCTPPSPEARPEVDGEGGVDNSFGHNAYPLVEVAVGDLEATAREAMSEGVSAILVTMEGWNGKPNDPRVKASAAVTVYGAAGMPGDGVPLARPSPEGPVLPNGDPAPPPAWQGEDWFWASDRDYIDGDPELPRIVDDNGYVADGRLVVSPPDGQAFRFVVDGMQLTLRLSGAVATGRITPDGLDDFVVAGRWGMGDMIATAEDMGICKGSLAHDLLISQLDRIADVRLREDESSADLPCNALSLAIGLRGVPARFAGVTSPGPIASECP